MDKPVNVSDYSKGTIYLDSKVESLRLRNNNLVIYGDTENSIPINQIGSIIIRGSTSITTNILIELIKHGVTISLLDYYGNYKTTLNPDIAGNIDTRYSQYKISESDAGFKVGKKIIAAKVENQISVLDRHLRNYGSNQSVDKAISRMTDELDYIKIAFNRDQLLGYEGNIASIYFDEFNELILNKDFRFNGRSYRPPLDEVNALLSYGYGLLRNDIEKCIRLCGLDPCIGFIHSIKSGKSSLALDMMEEYRPYMIDRLVLSLINKNIVKICNFTIENNAVYCDKETRLKLIEAWESKKQTKVSYNNKSTTYGELLFKQTRLLVAAIKGLDEYKPYIWR